MILGSYYLTMVNNNNPENSDYNPDDPFEPGARREAKDENGELVKDENGNQIYIYNTYTSVDEAMMAYDEGDIGLLGFIDRTNPDNIFTPEIDILVNKKVLGKIIDKCIKVHGTATAADVLDKIKAQGYRYSTRSGITVAVIDATIPPQKKALLEVAEKKVARITKNYERGLITSYSSGVISISFYIYAFCINSFYSCICCITSYSTSIFTCCTYSNIISVYLFDFTAF